MSCGETVQVRVQRWWKKLKIFESGSQKVKKELIEQRDSTSVKRMCTPEPVREDLEGAIDLSI